MITCNICKKNKATLKIQRTINNKSEFLNICLPCAKKLNIPLITVSKSNNYLSKYLKTNSTDTQHLVCTSCGSTIESIKKSNRIGCADCYSTFSASIKGVIESIDNERNISPPAVSESQKTKNTLTNMLNRTMLANDYNGAQKILDKLKSLEVKK